MRYTEDPQAATNLLNSIEDSLDAERGAKTDNRPHMSDLVYCLRASWRKRRLTGRTKEEENNRLVLLIGQALHTIVAKATGREANKRLETDWLVGEADAILESGVIEEFKTTRTGFSLDDPVKAPHYIEQVATYIVMAREMGLLRAVVEPFRGILHVLHLTFGGGPRWYEPHPKQLKKESYDEYVERLNALRATKRAEYEQAVADWIAEEGKHSNLRSWPLEFDLVEIDEWEKELKRRAKIWSSDTEPDVNENVPADKTGFSWTCSYCPFFVKRGGDCLGGIGRASSFFPIDRLDGEIEVGVDEEE